MTGNDERNPSLTVDGIVVVDGRILLIERGRAPYAGRYALPGGFVDYGETVEDAVRREIEEETGLKAEIVRLMGVYSDPRRDPRGHTVSVVFIMDLKGGFLNAGDDAADAVWFPLENLPPLAFDHEDIVSDYLMGHRDDTGQ